MVYIYFGWTVVFNAFYSKWMEFGFQRRKREPEPPSSAPERWNAPSRGWTTWPPTPYTSWPTISPTRDGRSRYVSINRTDVMDFPLSKARATWLSFVRFNLWFVKSETVNHKVTSLSKLSRLDMKSKTSPKCNHATHARSLLHSCGF